MFESSLSSITASSTDKVCSLECVLVAQSCPTLCEPRPVSSIHGILQARVLEWVAISFSRRSSPPRDQTWVSLIAGRRFTIWATGEQKTEWAIWISLHVTLSLLVSVSLSLSLFCPPPSVLISVSLYFDYLMPLFLSLPHSSFYYSQDRPYNCVFYTSLGTNYQLKEASSP